MEVGGDTYLLPHDEENGRLTGSSIEEVADSYGINDYGELDAYEATVSSTSIWTVGLERDGLGRITSKTETVGGVTSVTTYGYDEAGRLETVDVDEDNDEEVDSSESYAYDLNGNRYPAGETGVDVDAQDRLRSWGDVEYGYTNHGTLLTRTDTSVTPAETTMYTYDPLGALREVELADETLVEYGVDALGRRVRRSVDSMVTHRYLYHGSRVVAEVDGSGDVTSRYVYASRGHVPDLLIRGGVTYRLLTDPLGSVRRVVNVDSGVVAQRIDYDVWGKVVSDTSPGFQPFGFAGGLYDPLTGLVRFGARDYDAETGRWTAKDPIRFDGGDGNLYAYVGNDPVNRVDSSGLEPDDTFDTPDGAAADWAEHMSDVTGGDKGEWASDIYRTLLGEYSYTHLINCGSYNECQRPPFMKSWPLKKTAECHSHPLNEPGAEFVGDPDKQKAKNRRPVMDSYVRTGDGKLYRVFGGSGYALPLPLD